MPVEIYAPQRYLKFISYIDEGLNSTTHLANIDFPSGTNKAVVKMFPASSMKLTHEAIAYTFAEALHIPQPKRAGFIFLSRSDMPNPPTWMDENAIAWCCQYIDKDCIKPWFNKMRGELADDKKTKKALFKISTDLNQWLYAARASAFDDWLSNVDRNMGNLIRLGKGKYAVIDHDQILHTLDHTKKTKNKLLEMLAIKKDYSTLLNAMLVEQENHQLILDKAWENVLYFIHDILDKDTVSHIESYIHQKSCTKNFKRMHNIIV
ncbi:MAG: hypothetical protein R8M45_11975 [Ghiorsea sp.]